MRFLPFLSIVLMLSACGPSPRRIVLGSGAAGPTTGGTVMTPPLGGGGGGGTVAAGPGSADSLAPLERLNVVNDHLQSNGYQRIGSAVHNANLSPGMLVAHPMETTRGGCYIAVALGSAGADVNMVIIDGRGQTVGHNVLPDANPWVRVCSSEGGRFIVRVQMASGGGEHYFAYFQGDGDPRLATLIGGAAPTSQAAAMDPATSGRLQAMDQRLSQGRYTRVGEVTGSRVAEGETSERGLQLTAGQCYAFASFGGEGTRDTDLSILNNAGEVVEREASRDVDSLIEFCPSASGRYSLSAKMYSGEGPMFLAGWMRGGAAQVQANTNIIDNTAQTSGLAENYALINADISARGYESYGDSARGSLSEGSTRDFPLSLEGGKCYAIVAVGDGRVRDLGLVLKDPRGRELDRDVGTDARPIVRVCPENTGEYTMSVNMVQGGGDFMYHAYRWPRGTRGPFGLNGLIYVRLGEVTSLLGQEGYTPSADFTPGRGRLRREGARGRHNIELPAGRCFSILVVGGDGVNDLDISLSQNGEQIAGDESRNAFPNVRHCTQSAGTIRLNVQAVSGHGGYYYQVFESR